jgi:hypothetical protein
MHHTCIHTCIHTYIHTCIHTSGRMCTCSMGSSARMRWAASSPGKPIIYIDGRQEQQRSFAIHTCTPIYLLGGTCICNSSLTYEAVPSTPTPAPAAAPAPTRSCDSTEYIREYKTTRFTSKAGSLAICYVICELHCTALHCSSPILAMRSLRASEPPPAPPRTGPGTATPIGVGTGSAPPSVLLLLAPSSDI